MCGEPLDLAFRPLDHQFEVVDELPVDRVVSGPKCVKGSSACPVENAEHRELLVSRSLDTGPMPGQRTFVNGHVARTHMMRN